MPELIFYYTINIVTYIHVYAVGYILLLSFCTVLCRINYKTTNWRPENVAQLRTHIVKLCRALSEDLCRKVVTNARVRLQEVVRQNGGHNEHVLH